MPDQTFSNARLLALVPTLSEIGELATPPSPKGRYVLGRALDKATLEHTDYQKRYVQFLETVVTQDEKGKPIFHQQGNGSLSFTIDPEKKAEYEAGKDALESEMVTLVGIRQITHAELGACPITVKHEGVLIACGLLEDIEPT